MPDPFKLLGVDPERAKQGAAYAGTQALDLLYTPLYMKALGDALSSFMGSTPQQPQQEAPTPEAAPYQALTGALMEPLRRVGQEQSGRVAELEALYPQFVQEALTGMRGLGDQYAEANPELGPILAIMQLFHGSPHRFSKFKHADEVARTGEGANSYGHGIYLAENPAVAHEYWARLGKPKVSVETDKYAIEATRHPDPWVKAAGDTLKRTRGDIDAAIEDWKYRPEMGKPVVELLQKWKRDGAKVDFKDAVGGKYQVAGDFDPEDLLDWDAPLRDQPKALELARKNLTPQRSLGIDGRTGATRFAPMAVEDADGAALYRALTTKLGSQEAASKALADAGIPGLRYFDQGSRTTKDGTRNVVWWGDPDKLQIQGVDKSRP